MNVRSADAIVVHGHGLTPEGQLDSHTIQRMNTALTVWQEGRIPTLALSGGHSFILPPPTQAEAVVMEEYAVQQGVPKENIAIEANSHDTVGNVLFTKTTLALPNSWKRLFFVTSESHFARTQAVYGHVFGEGFEIEGIVAPEQIGFKERVVELLGSAMVREILRGTKAGDHQTIQKRLFDLVPGYVDGNSTVSRLAFYSLTGLLKRR